MDEKAYFVIGDAEGVDSLIQQFLHSNKYRDVTIYTSNNSPRNNKCNWDVRHVEWWTNRYDFYRNKDQEMVNICDLWFMIWDWKSGGTKNNKKMLKIQKKDVLILNLKNICNFLNSFSLLDLKNSIYWIQNQRYS